MINNPEDFTWERLKAEISPEAARRVELWAEETGRDPIEIILQLIDTFLPPAGNELN